MLIDRAIRDAADGVVPSPLPSVLVERTPNPEHGDYSVTLPLRLARTLRQPPMQIAERLSSRLDLPANFARITVAPPGFINLRVQPAWLRQQVAGIIAAGADWGRSTHGAKVRVQVEFVSSNPTGPLLFSHARGAVVGDVVARVLEASDFDVQREYYVNDRGRQVRLFGESLRAFITGEPVPEGGYQSDYAKELATAVASDARAQSASLDPALLARLGMEHTMASIREDLDRLGVKHDQEFSESSLYDGHWDRETWDRLRAAGRLQEREGALWFSTGTDKDEVVFKRDGDTTYFAADILYHRDKLERRGFQRVIDVWGADHQGQVGRVKLALQAPGLDSARLYILIVQLVSVKRGAESVRMSRRAGVGITLRDMLDEVGADAVRYFFLMRSADAHMQFDVDLAKQQSSDNPVYYAQYAHARLANVLSFGSAVEAAPALDRLDSEWESELLRVMVRWPDVVREAADALEPHRLAFYTDELAAAIHRFYKNCRVVTEDDGLSAARLQLCRAARITIANALGLMGGLGPGAHVT